VALARARPAPLHPRHQPDATRRSPALLTGRIGDPSVT